MPLWPCVSHALELPRSQRQARRGVWGWDGIPGLIGNSGCGGEGMCWVLVTAMERKMLRVSWVGEALGVTE